MTNIKFKDYHGYRQHKEQFEVQIITDNGEVKCKQKTRWIFTILSFDSTTEGANGYCFVLRTDGTKSQVPIDDKNRIMINGKKFSPNFWNH